MKANYRVVLFDVDGVLVIPPKLFSEQYCQKYSVDPVQQVRFYDTQEFKAATLGKLDLKDAIRLHNDKWQWHGEFDELIRLWLDAENYPNESLLALVKQLRAAGSKVYLATQQEKYRAEFLKNVVFKDTIDGMFCSCDIGFSKHEDRFWEAVLEQLQGLTTDLHPPEVTYFDDRQNLVDLASGHGIAAFLYQSVDQVQDKVFTE